MTDDQAENRYERVAYIIQDGEISIADAENYCDTRPNLYGIRPQAEIQQELI